MKKYLAYYENEWPANIAELTSVENKPFVGYLKGLGVSYTVVPKKPTSAYQMIDLGLPSGTLWADRNVGATSPEDVGLYFQWGDTVGYTAEQVGVDKVFDWDNYKFYVGPDTFFAPLSNKYHSEDNLTILESMDDAAYINMGDTWHMPTVAQFQELIDNTTHERITNYNGTGVNGLLLTGNNGNTLFLPAAGYVDGSSVDNLSEGTSGCYWANTNNYTRIDHMNPGYPDVAYGMEFDSTRATVDPHYSRHYGLPVRGVQAQ